MSVCFKVVSCEETSDTSIPWVRLFILGLVVYYHISFVCAAFLRENTWAESLDLWPSFVDNSI